MSRLQLPLLAPVSPLEPTPGEDVAYTPPSRAHAIVRALLPDLGSNPLVCDPHAGGGAFLRAFQTHGLAYRAREIDPAAVALLHNTPATRPPVTRGVQKAGNLYLRILT